MSLALLGNMLQSRGRGGALPDYVYAIDYLVHGIPRINTNFTIVLDNSIPFSSSYSWSVKDLDTGVEVASSVARNPVFNLTTVGLYDVEVVVDNLNTLDRHQRGQILVTPQLDSPLTDYDLLVDLDAIMDGKGSNFTNSAIATVINGSDTVVCSANHGIVVNDWIRLEYGASFYKASTGTTGNTLILDRPYEGLSGVVINTTTRNFGHETTFNSPNKSYTFDGDVLDIGSYVQTNLLDRLGNDTGVDVRKRSEYKIAFKGEFLGYFLADNWVGGDSRNTYLHMYNIGKVRFFGYNGNLPYCMEWNGKMQNIIIDGLADTNYEYGIEFWGHQTRAGQLFFLNGRWNTGLICTGVEAPYTGADTAAVFSFDTVFAAHSNNVAVGVSGASTLTLSGAITTIPLAGRLVIHTVGGVYNATGSHYYSYSSYNPTTKVFTLTGTLSQTYTAGTVVTVNICSDYNWHCDDVIYHKCKVGTFSGGSDEIFYTGFNNDSFQTNGWIPSHIEGVKIGWNIIWSSGRDGIQPGGCRPRLEIFNNLVLNSGMKVDFNHTSMVSWNDGNEGWLLRNIGMNNREGVTYQSGHFGGRCVFFANLISRKDSTIGTVPSTYIFIGIEAGLPPGTFINPCFIHNTVISPDSIPFLIQHNDPTNVQADKFICSSNAVVKAPGSQANYPHVKVNTSPAVGRGNWKIDDYVVDIGDVGDAKFKDYAGNDFDVEDKSSPLYFAGVDTTADFPDLPYWYLRDVDGYSLIVDKEGDVGVTAGYKSGYRAWVVPDLIPPVMSNIRVTNAFPSRLYFDMTEPYSGSTVAGFSLNFSIGTPRTITGYINLGSSGYFTLSGPMSIGDSCSITYSGVDDWEDEASTPNPLGAFSGVTVDNQLVIAPFRTLLDIGATYPTNIDDLLRYWNNITTFNAATLYSGLINSDNNPSSIELYVVTNLNGVATGTIGDLGQVGSSVGYPISVWRDYHSGGFSATAQFELRNMPTTHKYNLKFSGSRAAVDANRVIEARVQNAGVWGSWVAVDCSQNNSLFATFTDIIEDGSNKIICEVRARQSPLSAFSYLGIIDIEAIVL